MASVARSVAAKKAAETRKQNRLIKEAAAAGQKQGALRTLLMPSRRRPAQLAAPQRCPRAARAAVKPGAVVVASRGGPRFAFDDSGAARSMGDRLGRCGLFVVPEEAGDSGNDDVLFGAGQCSTPGKRAPEDEELLDEGSGGGTAALGEQTPAAKRSQPKGTGVDDIARWSAQKTPCRNTGVKSQKAEEKAADGEATLDRRAVKLLEERFRDFGKVDEIKTLSDVDGVLLWDALRSVRGAAARVHDHQVRDLRKRFAPPGTAEHDLRIRFPEDAWGRGPGALGPSRASDEVSPDLLAAIRLSKDPSMDKRSNGDFVAYMSECEGLNQKELVVCLRDVAGNNALVQPARQEYISALMECIVRCDLDKRFPQEVQLLQTVWDDCLQVIFSSFGKRSNPFADFWAIYAPHCRLAMDEADALTAAGCEEQSPEKVLPACVRLLNSSHLGRSLFHDVARKGAEGWLKQLMTAVLDGIKPPITQRKMNAADQRVKAEMDRLQVHVLLRGKRPVLVAYRRVPVKCMVASAQLRFSQEWTFVRAGWLKDRGLECGALQALEPVPEPQDEHPEKSMEPGLVNSFQLANSHVDASLEKSKKKDAESLLKVIENQTPKWRVHDRTFVLQLGWLQSQQGGKARDTFEHSVLFALSPANVQKGYKHVLAHLAEFKDDGVTLFCGSIAEEDLRKITALVGALYHGKEVTDVSPFQKTPFRRKALGAIEQFCVCRERDENGEEVSKLTGRAAMKALYAEFERALQAGQLLAGALKPFHTFKWMLSGEQQDAVREARNNCIRESLQASGALVSADAEVPDAVAADAGPRPKKAKKSAAASAVDSEMDSLLA
ncbi:unnamed protein product [Prorocentrum cordatum]|uniref:Uncharacterized protein n=1 Tax=Prorocentrum cordatum TaxID=2364126 RepID=A0ABN9XDB3_9DINO|nr:unnamed protein product [Polarella glacialis]